MPLKISYLLVFCLLLSNNYAFAQLTMSEGHKNAMYFYWGYNRSFFSKSNIHLHGPNYDFTVYKLKATDRPIKFGWVYFNPETISIPQYNFRLGYYLTDRFSISLGMDHMKYVVKNDQNTTISGVIGNAASAQYAGSYLAQPIQLSKDLLAFEHTNGFNLLTLNFEYRQPIAKVLKDKIAFSWHVGIGGLWVITKTDVKVMGYGADNRFHLAGVSLSAVTGPRIEFWNRFFILGELKCGYAVLPWVLINNDAPDRADHNVSYLEYYFAAGVQFRLHKLFAKRSKGANKSHSSIKGSRYRVQGTNSLDTR